MSLPEWEEADQSRYLGWDREQQTKYDAFRDHHSYLMMMELRDPCLAEWFAERRDEFYLELKELNEESRRKELENNHE